MFGKIIDTVSDWLLVISILGMTVLTFVNAVLRYFLHTSMVQSEEFSRFFFIWLVYCGVVVACRHGGHVSVTVVLDALHGKAKTAVELARDLVVLAIMVVLFIAGIKYTAVANYPTASTGINFALVCCVLPISAGGYILCQLVEMRDHYLKKDKCSKEGTA